jgi:spectinomycin phosphotransferase
MQREPALPRDPLLQAIHAAYGVTATDLTFIPVGYAAACYRLQSGKSAHFPKFWPAAQPGTAAQRAHRAQGLRLARALYERGIYPRVSYPILTLSGAFSATYRDGDFALFPFIEATPLPAIWPPALQDEWGRTLATMHCATPALADVLPSREEFELSFLPDLECCLAQLEGNGVPDRPALYVARQLLRAGARDIQVQLARLRYLQGVVRRLPSPFVLCHTDMGSGNLLVDKRGQLYVLDWEEARVAPPEHDLHEARWIALERMVGTYREAGGAGPLYLDQFAFHILRRALADMTARLVRLLTTNTRDEEDELDLFGVEEWGFRQWAALNATLARIAAVLSA